MGMSRSMKRRALKAGMNKLIESNLLLREKAINGCADEVLTEAEYRRIENQIAQEMSVRAAKYYVYRTLAVAVKVIMENYNKIHVRKTRAENFALLYMRGFESFNNTEDITYYENYLEHWGIKIAWPELGKEGVNHGTTFSKD